MSAPHSILLLEDEPLILMDLEFAANDRGCAVYAVTNCEEAFAVIDGDTAIDTAVLDVTLADGQTCVSVAGALKERGIPFLLHSGDLNRREEHVRVLDAPLIAKPASSDTVIAAAIALRDAQNDH
ncbi:response regulator [Erythrobacter sp. Alg231-14]|uniref:response regulator n=1 Tax=Erythrobacter sp. Alg231-14 TaxID=1922225 RepID=UPI00307C4DD6